MEQTTPKLLTPAEVGQRIGRSRATVYRLINAGHIETVTLPPARGKGPGAVRVTPQALAKFIDSLRSAA